jgi:hypothetical protein
VVGSQAFSSTTAFNANIGGWNTASVTTLSSVCAPSAVAQPKCGGGPGPVQAVAAMWAIHWPTLVRLGYDSMQRLHCAAALSASAWHGKRALLWCDAV